MNAELEACGSMFADLFCTETKQKQESCVEAKRRAV